MPPWRGRVRYWLLAIAVVVGLLVAIPVSIVWLVAHGVPVAAGAGGLIVLVGVVILTLSATSPSRILRVVARRPNGSAWVIDRTMMVLLGGMLVGGGLAYVATGNLWYAIAGLWMFFVVDTMIRLLRALQRRLHARRIAKAKRRSLTEEAHWHVNDADFYRAVRALPDVVPPGSLLGLAEGSWSRDVELFLDVHGVILEPEVVATLPADFRDACFIPVDRPTILELVALETHHPFEVAIHLIVVRDGASLIEWYDLPDDPIAVSLSLEETAVAFLAEASGGRYEVSKAGE